VQTLFRMKDRLDELQNVNMHNVNGFQCKACVMGKGEQLPSPSTEIATTKPLGLVHIYMWRPATTISLGGARYFLFVMTTSQERSTFHFKREVQSFNWYAGLYHKGGETIRE
jgi:hypothetical protein